MGRTVCSACLQPEEYCTCGEAWGVCEMEDKDMESRDEWADMFENDVIHSPPHYKSGKYECIDIIEALDLGYHLGNCLKYIWRAGKKGDRLEDLHKAMWYLERYIEIMEPDDVK